MDSFERLLAHASSEIDGHDANRALWDARAELETRFSNVVCYEMVVGENDAWSDFLARTIPRVTEHLTAKGLPMLGAPSALFSIWRGPKMFMMGSREFFDAIREIEALDEHAFWRQISEWRQALGLSAPREAITPPKRSQAAAQALMSPLALPPNRSGSDELGSADVRISDDESEFRTDE